MPNWKKVITSGSNAALNSLNVTTSITGSDVKIDDWGSISGSLANLTDNTPEGSGTANYITKWSDSSSLTDSILYDDGTNIGIGTTTSGHKLEVSGDTKTNSLLVNASSPIAGSIITIANANSSTGTSVNEFHNITRVNVVDTPSIYTYGVVNRLDVTSDFNNGGILTQNNIARITGDGDIGTLYPIKNQSSVKGEGTVDWAIGGINEASLNNPLATVNNLWGTHTEVQLTAGTAGEISLLNFDFDQSAGTTITGDFQYINISNDQPVLNISGTARALNIESNLPSFFSGSIGIGTNSPSQILHVEGNARVTGAYYDSANSPGIGGQVLTSTATGTDWIDPTLLPAESAEKVIQSVRLGEAVSKGDPLVITDYHGSSGPAIVERADATDANKMPAYGVALEDYVINATGLMIAVGDFSDFDTSGYSIGDTLYVAVGGGMTNVKPTGTALIQNMGIVSRSNANNGQVEIVAIGRTNDVPNLPEGRLFVGTSGNTSLTSDVVYIDDANDRVGIGTASPNSKLDVNGNIAIASTSTFSDTNFISMVGSRALFGYDGSINSAFMRSSDSSKPLVFGSGTSEHMRVTGGGNVGIGTTNPQTSLDVRGTTTSSGTTMSIDNTFGESPKTLQFTYNGIVPTAKIVGFGRNSINALPYFAIEVNDTTSSTPSTNTVERLRILANGNVGIGTTSPNAKLHIATSESATTSESLYLENTGSGGNEGVSIKFNPMFGAESMIASNREGADSGKTNLTFHNCVVNDATPIERMRITSAGNVGIGTTSPDALLNIESTTAPTLRISNGGGTSPSPKLEFFRQSGVSSHIQYDVANKILTTDNVHASGVINYKINGSEKMRIATNGNVGIGKTNPRGKLTIGMGGHIIGDESFRIGTGGTGNTPETSIKFTENAQYFYVSNGIKMTVQAGGNVGIGTTTPSSRLSIAQGELAISNLAPGFTNPMGVIGTYNQDANNGGLLFKTISGAVVTEKMRILANGNVGIGTTTPGAKLDVTDFVDGNEIYINAGLGTANPTRFKVYNESYKGALSLYDDGNTEDVKITTGGASWFNGGNVGIGTTSPGAKLEVSTTGFNVGKFVGNTNGGTGYVGAVLEIESNNNGRGRGVYLTHKDSTDTTDSEWYTGLPYTGTGYTIGNAPYGTSINSDTGPAVLSQSRFFIRKDGNVGIGTTSPAVTLHVNGWARLNGSLQLDGPNRQIMAIDNTSLLLGTNNTEKMRITATGNVGIGTTSPDSTLTVKATVDSRLGGIGWKSNDGTNEWTIDAPNAGNFRIYKGTTPIARFDSSGNFGIGTTSPSSKLHVEDSIGNGSVFKITTSVTGVLQPIFDARAVLNGDTHYDFNNYRSSTKKIQIISANTASITQIDGSGGFDIKGHLKTSLQTVNGGGVLQLHRYGALSLNNDESYAHSPSSALYINTLYNTSTNYLMVLANEGNDKLVVDLSGNVGIGTTSPGAKLDIEGDLQVKGVNISNQENTDISGLELVGQVAIATYTAAFFDFVVKKDTNVRSGTVYACHDGTNVEFTETSTQDLGDTSDVVLSVDISGGNMRLLADAATSGWSVKSLVKAI